jgi:DnaJ-domain-containing protein 1
MKWILIILALLYFFLPYDLIPGVHPVGWIDDIVVMILLFRYLARLKRNGTAGPPPYGNQQGQQQYRPSGSAGSSETPKTPRSPYEILNVPSDADQAEIKAAYRKLANQYHPDKVAHLGKEFQNLAEQRFKEIQEAYGKLVS